MIIASGLLFYAPLILITTYAVLKAVRIEDHLSNTIRKRLSTATSVLLFLLITFSVYLFLSLSNLHLSGTTLLILNISLLALVIPASILTYILGKKDSLYAFHFTLYMLLGSIYTWCILSGSTTDVFRYGLS